MLGKLIVRSLGIISTLILVRLLSPSDFGIIAIAIMLIGFFEVLSDAGINRFLILRHNPTRDDYDSAWTLNIILRACLLGILFLLAPFASSFLKNPDLTYVIQITAAINLITSFQNIGLIKLERGLQYRPQNKLLIVAKVFSFTFCLIAAFIYKNYYALLVGNFINVLIITIGSYSISDYRPRFNFSFEKSMWQFSQFNMLRNIVGYTRSQMDIFIVGNKFGDTATGQFTISRKFAMLPQTELITPAMQPIFSGLSKFKTQPKLLMKNSMQVLFLCYLILIPCAFGLLAIAEPFTAVVLGDKWLPVADYIGVLSFLMIIFITQPVLHTLYDAQNKIGKSIYSDLFGILTLLLFVYSLKISTVAAFADIRILAGLFTFLFMLVCAKFFVELKLKVIAEIILPPMLASVIMYLSLISLNMKLFEYSDVSKLFILLVAGAVVYTILILIYFAICLTAKLSPQVATVYANLPLRVKKLINLQ